MTSGSRLEKVSLPKSVVGFHGVWTYNRVFQTRSNCSLGPPQQWGGRCPGWFLGGCLARSLLGSDVFRDLLIRS
jgi:hypothetical protein